MKRRERHNQQKKERRKKTGGHTASHDLENNKQNRNLKKRI